MHILTNINAIKHCTNMGCSLDRENAHVLRRSRRERAILKTTSKSSDTHRPRTKKAQMRNCPFCRLSILIFAQSFNSSLITITMLIRWGEKHLSP